MFQTTNITINHYKSSIKPPPIKVIFQTTNQTINHYKPTINPLLITHNLSIHFYKRHTVTTHRRTAAAQPVGGAIDAKGHLDQLLGFAMGLIHRGPWKIMGKPWENQ